MSSIIGIYDIMKLFQDEISVLKKGEKSFEAGNVSKIKYDGSLGILQGEIAASMKNKKYTAEVTFDDKGLVKEVSCTCPRGLFKCHHIAAVLIYANKNISKTDRICSWKAASLANIEESNPVSALYPHKNYYRAINRNVDDEDKKFFLNKLEGLNRFSGFYWLLQEEPCRNEIKWKTMQELLTSYNCKADIIANMKISQQDILQLAAATTGQRNNALWHQMRIGRLTASNFGAVIAAVGRNRYPPSLFSALLGKNNLEGVKSVQWGINNEQTAVKEFEEVMKMTVSPTGLWLHSSGILGASPDGLIGEDSIIEIKCPFKHRTNTISEIIRDKKYCLNDQVQLKTSHIYYHQIQGQLAILNKSLCYLVIWTTKETAIIPVNRDSSWEINLSILQNFYVERLIDILMQ